MTRAISTAWASYAIWRGPAFNANFAEIIKGPQSACALDFFQEFFAKRQQFEVRAYPIHSIYTAHTRTALFV
jgi:hypothetical protein